MTGIHNPNLALSDDGLTVAVLNNLNEVHSNPGMITHVVAGLVQFELKPAAKGDPS